MDEDTGQTPEQLAAAIVAEEGEECPCGDPFHKNALTCRRCGRLRPSVMTPQAFLDRRRVKELEIENADLLRENVEMVRRYNEAKTEADAINDLVRSARDNTERVGKLRDETQVLVTRYDELLAWGHELETENRALSAMLRASARKTVAARYWHRRSRENASQAAQRCQRWLKALSGALGTPWGGARQETVDRMVERAMLLRLQSKHRCRLPETGAYGQPFTPDDVGLAMFSCMCGMEYALEGVDPVRWFNKPPPVNEIEHDDEGYPIGV